MTLEQIDKLFSRGSAREEKLQKVLAAAKELYLTISYNVPLSGGKQDLQDEVLELAKRVCGESFFWKED